MKLKYKSICEEITRRIYDGIYKESNNKLPDEISLCKEFLCSRMTMKKALDILVMDGLIYRKQGQGTFILENNLNDAKVCVLDRELQGLTKSSQGKATAKVLEFQLMFANEDIANNLNIEVNSPVYNILRLRYINDLPYVLERTYMSTILIPGINLEILDKSIYEYIEFTLNLKIVSAQKILRADCSNEQDQKYLELTPEEPVLEVVQTAYLDNGVPFEYSFSRHRYNRFEFSSFSVRR